MIRKFLVTTGFIALALVGRVAILYAANGAPAVPALSAADAASAKPYVIKMHARWCHFCLLQKDEWSRIEQTYAGRVNFVVLDATNEAATERSRIEAERLNLREFFEEYNGATGLVVVLDGRTREVLAEVGGNAPFEEFQSAIDGALARRRGGTD
jgi:thiol-disulfide isomerase/thioredoxin